MQLSRDAEAAEEVGDQSFCHCRHLLVGDGVYFWPLYVNYKCMKTECSGRYLNLRTNNTSEQFRMGS
jgi:hypothetical protein